MEIFNWFGSILGYLLWFLYEIIPNYGVAIILFTIITKLLLLPFSDQAAEIHGGQQQDGGQAAGDPHQICKRAG